MGKNLLEVIIEAAEDKKAKNIVSLDLSVFDGAIADHFVICSAESTTQVEAIARGIEEKVLEEIGEKPRRMEGMTNAHWVIIDYVDVMAHVFVTEAREFYKLEQLWADAPAAKYGEWEQNK